jgi:hypothetical protein
MKWLRKFFLWLKADWHISYTAVAFFWIAFKDTEGSFLKMMMFWDYHGEYFLIGLLVELVVRSRTVFPKRTIIPK